MKQFFNRHLRSLFAILVFYTMTVILWGAWVRISHSGDGCGASWPLCHGELIPDTSHEKTFIEYFHRLMSGVYGIYVLFLYLGTRQYVVDNPYLKKASKWLLILTITEALIGAKLVLFGLVAGNDSLWRVATMSIHGLNSLFLVAACVHAYMFACHPQWKLNDSTPALRFLSRQVIPIFLFFVITGTAAALANTLFPDGSLIEGLTKDFDPDSHYLIHLRIVHPILVLCLGGWFLFQFYRIKDQFENLILTLPVTMLFGLATLLFLSPIWMKIVHLGLGHFLWIVIVHTHHKIKYRHK